MRLHWRRSDFGVGRGGKVVAGRGFWGGCFEGVTIRGVYPRLRGLYPWRMLRYCGHPL